MTHVGATTIVGGERDDLRREARQRREAGEQSEERKERQPPRRGINKKTVRRSRSSFGGDGRSEERRWRNEVDIVCLLEWMNDGHGGEDGGRWMVEKRFAEDAGEETKTGGGEGARGTRGRGVSARRGVLHRETNAEIRKITNEKASCAKYHIDVNRRYGRQIIIDRYRPQEAAGRPHRRCTEPSRLPKTLTQLVPGKGTCRVGDKVETVLQTYLYQTLALRSTTRTTTATMKTYPSR